jgi:hypothetical protein
MLKLTCFNDCIRAVFVPSVFVLNAWGILCSVFCLFVLLFLCASADGTANSAAISQRREDELKKKLAGNYKLSMTVTKCNKLDRASEA